MRFTLLDLPHWVGEMIFFVVLLAALELGYRVGVWQYDKWEDAEDGGGNLVLTSVLALLGLLLAFTFADGVSHYKTRKQAVISEANALGTAFLRADMVADPGRTELKQALLDYARTRAVKPGTAYSTDKARELVAESTQAMAKLWPTTMQILQQQTPGPLEASLVAAINNVIDHNAIRNTALFDKLPPIVLLLLIFITSAALAVAGFNAGLSGRMSRWRMIIFAMVLAGVVLVIRDFDIPTSGFIVVSHDNILSVIDEMEANLHK
ncbi:MAG: hypothetical protein QNI91_08640 [Arenicellales bacterium]|nr:hypothetical protein [Arenicellales bacterium]